MSCITDVLKLGHSASTMQSKRDGVLIPTKMEFIEQFLVLASSIEIDVNPLNSLRDETLGRTGE